MKKMTADEFDNIFYSTDIRDRHDLWSHIKSLQSKLEAMEGRKGIWVRKDLVSKLKGYAVHDVTCQKGHISVSNKCTCGLTEVLKEIDG